LRGFYSLEKFDSVELEDVSEIDEGRNLDGQYDATLGLCLNMMLTELISIAFLEHLQVGSHHLESSNSIQTVG
jgi:hypothetical protein